MHPVFGEQLMRDRIGTLRADGAAARRSLRPLRRWRRAFGARLVSAGFRLQGVAGR
ncbi:MAG TPA: hypothetical protein VF029_01100 [Actinomycetota bacterium]